MNNKITNFVSVIIPTRNRQHKLIRAVKSVATQTYQNVELVVVDDGSDQLIDYDAIQNIWNEYRSSHFLKIIYQQHSNANVARNRGADESKGDFIIFLDSDDLLAPWAIERRLKLSFKYKGIICGNAECFNETPGDLKKLFNLPIDENPLDRFLNLDFPWQTSGPMWPRNVFYSIGKFDAGLPSWQDWELSIRALILGIEFKQISSCDHFINISGGDKTSYNQFKDIDHLSKGFLLMCQIEKTLFQYQLVTENRIYSLQMIKSCLAYCLIENQGYSKTLEFIKKAPLDINLKLEHKLFAHRLSKELPSFLQKKIIKRIWGVAINLNYYDRLSLKFSIPDLIISNKIDLAQIYKT